jgi:hypothetical protein
MHPFAHDPYFTKFYGGKQTIVSQSTMAKKYPLNDHQLKVCKYSLLTGIGIADIRHNLVDLYNKPVFDGIPTSYLNRTIITNQRTALRSFQKNYGGKCKSKYQPLAANYQPYPDFRPTEGSDRYYPPLTQEQHQSQFVPPVQNEVYCYDDINYKNINMANSFSHLNRSNRRVQLPTES